MTLHESFSSCFNRPFKAYLASQPVSQLLAVSVGSCCEFCIGCMLHIVTYSCLCAYVCSCDCVCMCIQILMDFSVVNRLACSCAASQYRQPQVHRYSCQLWQPCYKLASYINFIKHSQKTILRKQFLENNSQKTQVASQLASYVSCFKALNRSQLTMQLQLIAKSLLQVNHALSHHW